MNQLTQDQRTLAGLRIAVEPSGSDREVTFTATGDSGGPLQVVAYPDNGGLANLYDVFSRIAAHAAPAEGGLPFGQPDGARIILSFEGYTGSRFQFVVTVAYPNGDAGYLPITLRAPITEAALGRLVDGVRHLNDGTTTSVDWTVAD